MRRDREAATAEEHAAMAERARTELLARRLREARERAGLSQQDVADALDVHRPVISMIESGGRAVKALELAPLARLYGVPVEQFLRGL